LDLAKAMYEKLLAASPKDPDLLGLLGVLALQQGRAGAAEDLLRSALQPPQPDPGVHLRNLNNLFVVLHEQGHDAAVQALASADLPDWPADRRPDKAQRDQALSLAEALALAGRPERGAALLGRLSAASGGDAELLVPAGQLWLTSGDPSAALAPLEAACACDPANWRPHAALSAAHFQLGDAGSADKATAQCLRAAPVYLAPARDGQVATILCLNSAPQRIENANIRLHDLHFVTNYISQLSNLKSDDFRFASVFANLPDPPADLPDADVVFNNIASGEAMNLPGRLEQAEALIARVGLPVINTPRAVQQMTRQRAAELLEGIPGLRVPRIARYRRDMALIESIEADIAANFTYPVILRHVAADSSSKSLVVQKKTAVQVADAAALRQFLESVDWPQFYVLQYIDLHDAEGHFRKLRAVFFPDEIIFVHCTHHSAWMVGGRNDPAPEFYRRFPHRLDEMLRIVRDPRGTLGPGLWPVLEAIHERVPLEVFGMDFDVDDQGRVVLFEAQSTMIFMPPAGTPDHLITPEIDDRVNEAFRRLVRAKIAGRA
jgi:Flp pilus assembly protein TadD